MRQIYYISGLGADERVFQFLQLDSPPGIPIKWIRPEGAESLTDYAKRLTDQIDTTQDGVLIGLSFGGIMAQEIARHIECRKVIIISSVKSAQELSWQLAFIKHSRLYSILPPASLKWLNKLTADYYFSTESASESRLLRAIIEDTDGRFVQWAIDQLMQWQPIGETPAVLHIHGTQDRIFPIRRIRNAVVIEGGGHFMIVNRAAQISSIINLALQQL